jgi:hypothetical protein
MLLLMIRQRNAAIQQKLRAAAAQLQPFSNMLHR